MLDLVAEHIGGTNAKTEKILNKAEGRLLFVDEAYTLLLTSGKVYGKEASDGKVYGSRGNDGEYRRENKKRSFYICRVSL